MMFFSNISADVNIDEYLYYLYPIVTHDIATLTIFY